MGSANTNLSTAVKEIHVPNSWITGKPYDTSSTPFKVIIFQRGCSMKQDMHVL